MSKLRERLTKMAEPSAWQEMQQEKRDNMQLSDSAVCRDYPDPKYKNQKGMVSPLNILLMDHANLIYGMPFDEAVSFVIDNISALNDKYEGDPFYDTFSDKSGGYLRKLEYKLKNLKPKTPEKIMEYLTNAMYKGMTNLATERQKGLVKESDVTIDKQKYIKLVEAFKEAMFNLEEAWDGKTDEEYDQINNFLATGYPFEQSFDEVYSKVTNWLDILKNNQD